MNIGTAKAIFDRINECQNMEIKGLAIRTVLDMETHNSVTKKTVA